MIANRMSKIDASGIRRVFDLASKMKNPINLSIGQPDFDISQDVKDAGINAIQQGKNRYTPSQGTQELNSAVKNHIKKQYGYTPDATMVTSGVSGGLFLLLMATVNPGDEVVFPDPYFVMYKHLVNLLGGKAVPVPTNNDFQLNLEELNSAINQKTKLLIINSPNNPTGAVYDEESLKQVAEIAQKNDLLVVSDEIYSTFCYDYDSCPSIAPYYQEKTLILNGFSKSDAMTGWRVGYAAGPSQIIEEMIKLQQYTYVCAPSFAQEAALSAIARKNEWLESYSERRNLIYKGLSEAGYSVAKPGGAFYIFPECPIDEDKFIERAFENNLLIIPGSVFSDRQGYFRISFAADFDTLEKGIEVLKKIR